MYLRETTADALTEMADDAERCADLLSTADLDVIAYGCTTGSLVEGPGYDEEIESRLADAAGAPAVATAASVKRAFDALDIESVAVTTPYVEELNRREAEFLEAAGYEVTDIEGLDIERNTEIGTRSPEMTYRRARSVDSEAADGLFVSCTNYRTFEVIPALERDLGKPVVTSNQATLWDALRKLEVADEIDGLGRLIRQG
jgi:maleate isomerase